MELYINGMGIIMYCDYAVSDIKEGENYFSANYNKATFLDLNADSQNGLRT